MPSDQAVRVQAASHVVEVSDAGVVQPSELALSQAAKTLAAAGPIGGYDARGARALIGSAPPEVERNA